MSIMSVNMAMLPNRILHMMEERKNESEVLVYQIYKRPQGPQKWFDNCPFARTAISPAFSAGLSCAMGEGTLASQAFPLKVNREKHIIGKK